MNHHFNWEEATQNTLAELTLRCDDLAKGRYNGEMPINDYLTKVQKLEAEALTALSQAFKKAVDAAEPEEIEEGDGWNIYFTNGKEKGKVRPCCPGDDIAYAHNQATAEYKANLINLIDSNHSGRES